MDSTKQNVRNFEIFLENEILRNFRMFFQPFYEIYQEIHRFIFKAFGLSEYTEFNVEV